MKGKAFALVASCLAAADGFGCSLDGYDRDPPLVDHGVVAGKSPASPLVVDATLVHDEISPPADNGCLMGPSGGNSCDGVVHSYLLLRVRGADEAALFRLTFFRPKADGGVLPPAYYATPYAAEGDEIVVRSEYDYRETPPFSFELAAYDADGYSSEPVRVDVTDEVGDGVGDGGCAVGRSPAGLWLLALGLLLARRLTSAHLRIRRLGR